MLLGMVEYAVAIEVSESPTRTVYVVNVGPGLGVGRPNVGSAVGAGEVEGSGLELGLALGPHGKPNDQPSGSRIAPGTSRITATSAMTSVSATPATKDDHETRRRGASRVAHGSYPGSGPYGSMSLMLTIGRNEGDAAG
jgi:hypothetical protein